MTHAEHVEAERVCILYAATREEALRLVAALAEECEEYGP